MQGKVEICGVNTSKLQTLSNAEMMRLIERSQQGDMDARSRLVEGNLKLVLSVVQRFLSRGENPDDLFQVGCIGLLKAIANFDTTKNVRFSTYGVPMIAGELRRYLRDYSPIRVSRSLRDTAYRVLQCRQQLTDQNGREPSIDEIAQALDREAALIESRIWPGAAVIAMCVEGKPMSSEQLADYFSRLTVSGTSKICLLIGGSCGLSERVKQRAALRLSMSPMTFPHHLARVMVLEQIYRALNIAAGGKYHK